VLFLLRMECLTLRVGLSVTMVWSFSSGNEGRRRNCFACGCGIERTSYVRVSGMADGSSYSIEAIHGLSGV